MPCPLPNNAAMLAHQTTPCHPTSSPASYSDLQSPPNSPCLEPHARRMASKNLAPTYIQNSSIRPHHDSSQATVSSSVSSSRRTVPAIPIQDHPAATTQSGHVSFPLLSAVSFHAYNPSYPPAAHARSCVATSHHHQRRVRLEPKDQLSPLLPIEHAKSLQPADHVRSLQILAIKSLQSNERRLATWGCKREQRRE